EEGIKVQPNLVARGTTALCRPQPRRQGGRFVFLTLHDRLWIDRPGDHDFASRIKIEYVIDQVTLGLELKEHIGNLPPKRHQQAREASQQIERQAVTKLPGANPHKLL